MLIRLRPPAPRTVGLIAKHAARDSYHWVLMVDHHHAGADLLARLLAVAYLDEASGLLGRGDPRWAVPRAYLRTSGELDLEDRPRWDSEGLPPAARRELARIVAWLGTHHAPYLEELSRALRGRNGDHGFRALSSREVAHRGFQDPTGRALLAPPPPPVVTGTKLSDSPDLRLPWRRARIPPG